MTNMSTLKTTGATGHRDLPLDKLILYIKNVLSNIRKKDSRKDVLYSGKKLKRLVQRFTSDHSKLVESISEGANKISDKELLKPKWSTVAREVTLAILKGLDIFQSPAAAVASVVANVAERFDEIPAIDRECIDLLEEMLESVKFFKRIKDRQLDLHIQRPLETISNAVESAVTGAIVCHSIIRWKTTTRLPLTKVIREELGYVKDKIRSSDQKLVHEICLLPFNKGGMEENRPPNQEESPSLRSSGLHAQEEGLSLEGDKWHWVVGIMVSVTLVKLALVKAFAQDHFFDVITNTIGLFAAVLASTFYWWIDPSGAIVVVDGFCSLALVAICSEMKNRRT